MQNETQQKRSATDKLTNLIVENLTSEGFVLSRNLGVGAAGISVVLLLTLLQIDEITTELVISAIGLGVAIPFWVVYFGSQEYFIYLDPKYLSHSMAVKNQLSFMLLIAGGGLTISMCSLLWYISIWAGALFIVSLFAAIITSVVFARKLAHSIFNKLDK